jgi:radical SAM protein with 4Fe4S-binding SPASM domain
MEYSFRDYVSIVEIENSSFCNRKCSYCINYHIDRFSKNEIMEEVMYQKIINELSDIEYGGMVTFHRYNEPFFSQNQMILERIAYAREKLPKANLVTSTNSDYIDESYLKKIQKAGLDSLYMQCHTENYATTSDEDICNAIYKINERIGLLKGKMQVDNKKYIYHTIGSGFHSLTIQARNFTDTGFSRGEIVDNVKKEIVNGCCYQPLISMTIDYNGNVTVCSNTVSYYDKHKEYVLGNVGKTTLDTIYCSDKAKYFRAKLLRGEREPICKHCSCNYEKWAKRKKVQL